MGIFPEKRVAAEVIFRPDGSITVEFRGRQQDDIESLGLLCVGYLAKLAWDTAREPRVVGEAMRHAAHYICEAPAEAELLAPSPIYKAWMAGPPEERVRGAKARYRARLVGDGLVNTGLPFRNLAFLHSLSVLVLGDRCWTKMDYAYRDRLKEAVCRVHSLLSAGSGIAPGLSGLRRLGSASRDAWLARKRED